MQESREDTFSGNKNDNAHEHVERVLDIVSLFNIPGVSHDAVMLCVFPITLTRAAKRWLEEIRNFKQEGDETLYQAWERNIKGSSNSKGIAAIISKLDNLGRYIKKLKENVHTIQVGCQNCGGAHLDKDCPLNEEVKSVEEEAKLGGAYEQTPGGIKAKKSRDGRIDLGAGINVIPKTMFEHLKLAQLKKTDMLVEMANMTKRSPIRIVENVLVKIDKFLFPSDFVVMDMLNTRNETMILGRPFLATIHAKIDVFNKEISLGIRGDRVTFDMNKKIHNFITPIGEIYMINSTSNSKNTFHTSSDASSRVEKTDDLHNENNYCNQEQGRKDLVKDPRERSFGDYKWMFDLEVDQLADEYELGIGKKGHMLDDIWENCKKVQGDNTYCWHDQKSEEEERRELRINIEEYDPQRVHVETFEIKRYSFDSGQNFICVSKELMNALSLGRENGARFRDMIRKEVDSGRRIHRKT
ncbi:putative reverse transcriptase domain-containing protein [Tanacetum coccineum]